MKHFEDDGHLLLHTPAGEIRLDRYNSALFTHIGKLAMYDHVFVQKDMDDETMFGSYLFRHNPSFGHIASWMVENDLPMHLNFTEVAETDMDAFNQSIAHEAEEPIPDGWLDS